MLKSCCLALALLPCVACASPQWLLVKQDGQSTLAVLMQAQNDDPSNTTSAVLLEMLPQTATKKDKAIDYFYFFIRFDCSVENRAQLKSINAFNLRESEPVIALKVDGPIMDDFGQANEWSVACKKTPSRVLGDEDDVHKMIEAYRAR